ncbi:MAG: M50 family metallopeptidase [Candidatus Desulfatibia sp.]|uniref:M50 family metallopeptidase n=1 Tax=Candidatus Desulfatibia sp. TaxID=3101189 RepID=UPI002F31A4C8
MNPEQTSRKIQWKELISLLFILLAVVYLWNTRVVYPLKILVVFFHELSHGVMAVITGGSIKEIRIVAAQGGVCVTAGGNRFLTLSAGYLGSLVLGGVILVLATRTRYDQTIATVIGGLMILISLLFVRPIISFGIFFGLLSGLAMIAAGKYLSENSNDFILKVIGLTSCLYAVLDIKSDVLDRPYLRSDARMLAELTHLPTIFWGLLWITIAVIAAVLFLLVACKTKHSKG